MEIWKDVVGYEGHYEVSNLGQVRRIGKGLAVISGRILKPRYTYDGYVKVKLCVHQKAKLKLVHILVLEAFKGFRPEPHMQCNHINGVRDDNRPENLDWVTPSQNLQHAYDMLDREPPRGETHGNAKLTDDDIREIRRLSALHEGYHSYENSYRDIAQKFGITFGLVGHIVRRKAWKHIE